MFVGSGGATAFGDYSAGSNHVLPTGGAAKFGRPLGPGAFMRRTAVVSERSAAAAELAPHVAAIAGAEGFPVTRRVGARAGEAMSSEARTARIERETGETKVSVELSLDGGPVTVSTGVGFFDHMLVLLGRHGRLGLVIDATGDLQTGAHHTVEDVGIAIGPGARPGARRPGRNPALRPRRDPDGRVARGMRDRRFGPAAVRVRARSAAGDDRGLRRRAGEEFFRAVANNAKLTVHVGTRQGSNVHHLIEAMFKAFARALRDAVAIDPDEDGVPSNKGTLT